MRILRIIKKETVIITVIAIVIGVLIGSRVFTPKPEQLTASLTGVDEDTDTSESITIPKGDLVKVAFVIDGDTIELENGERLRYIGIDTPEGTNPDQTPECYAKEATEENKKLVEGKEVIIEKDVNERDIYGRLLGYVYVDNIMVNTELVRLGAAFATPYPPDTKHQELIKSAEEKAISKNLGLWNTCNYSAENPPIPD